MSCVLLHHNSTVLCFYSAAALAIRSPLQQIYKAIIFYQTPEHRASIGTKKTELERDTKLK